jgi:putative Mg2+ transporter-C (MgtC) family protein
MDQIFDKAQLHILLIVVIAAILGGIVGFDREMRAKPAGIRTNMIVAAISCLLVTLGHTMVDVFSTLGDKVKSDPVRIIQAIIIGVSFIGGGTILKLKVKERVKNLSTAATLLFSATVGIAMGLHLYVVSVGITIFAFIIEYGVLQLEKKLWKNRNDYDLD